MHPIIIFLRFTKLPYFLIPNTNLVQALNAVCNFPTSLAAILLNTGYPYVIMGTIRVFISLNLVSSGIAQAIFYSLLLI